MTFSITLVRHARSEANAAGIWQGQGDAVLAEEGRLQARALAPRLARREFDVVISSDLSRTQETAELAGRPPDRLEKSWREMDLGAWEGRTFAEVAERHPDLLEAIRRGEAVSFGETGETIAEFEERVLDAFERLVDELGGEGHAVVFTHGGVIDAIVGRFFGRVHGRRTFPITTNTALTVLGGEPGRSQGRPRVSHFNDASHLGHDVGATGRFREDGIPIAGLVRHGVTEANKTGRIQGQHCWGLHDEGRHQARLLADWYGSVDRVISSPIRRARETAAVLASANGVTYDERLMEQSFGTWEGVLTSEMSAEDLGILKRIYADGEDLPRGHTGETFAALVARLADFVAQISLDPEERTAIVSHGAAIKAAVAHILGNTTDIQSNLAVSPNTGVTHVAFPPSGPMLIDYAIAPHLELS
ncbi:MAG: histidine phosphatase family protein [Acidimicrobiia bacterium]|nr:histidine phosphatase family protein [Acidimicrobiia bacterium]